MSRIDLTEQMWSMQLKAAHMAGQSLEREAIVDYLNDDAAALRDEDDHDYIVLNRYANAIERGDHLRGDDE